MSTGMRELSPPPLNLKRLFGETLESEPVLLIISAGADPSQELLELASQIVGRENYHEVRHTHTHVSFYGLQGLSIGVMVFKLYFLSPNTNPTPKPTTHRKLCAFFGFQKDTIYCVFFLSLLNYGDTKGVFINHIHSVIPMSLCEFVSS